jgi:hypothetical protein
VNQMEKGFSIGMMIRMTEFLNHSQWFPIPFPDLTRISSSFSLISVSCCHFHFRMIFPSFRFDVSRFSFDCVHYFRSLSSTMIDESHLNSSPLTTLAIEGVRLFFSIRL